MDPAVPAPAHDDRTLSVTVSLSKAKWEALLSHEVFAFETYTPPGEALYELYRQLNSAFTAASGA